jgi:ubiquinone biosynthesis protein COQ9
VSRFVWKAKSALKWPLAFILSAFYRVKMMDITLEALKTHLLPALLRHVPFDGWSRAALAHAAKDVGVPENRAALTFPHGAIDMVEAFVAWGDAELKAALPVERLAALKIREKVTLAVRTRLELVEPHREAVRRAINVLANPLYARRVTNQTWHTADIIWRLCGDTATDYNHYTKRMILSGVYAATFLYWLNDESDSREATWEFLDRRISGIMTFEKTKARFIKAGENRPSLTRFLGRLRYPA